MKRSKLLAISLIFLMLFTNTALIAAGYAAEAENTKNTQATTILTVDKSKAEQVEQMNTAEGSNSYEKLTEKEKAFKFGNSFLNYYLQNGKAQGPKWLKTAELQFMLTEDHKPVYSFETIQPLGGVTKKGQLWFWQGRYAHSGDNSSTANLGLGWRKLSPDKNSIVGLNAFYDYGFQYNLARIGLGAEYFNKRAEYRVNWYHPVSGDRQTGVGYLSDGILYSYIRAVDGLDFEAGTSFTHMPWLKIYAGGYCWDNRYNPDEIGYRLRTALQLTPRINMELGYLNSERNHSYYGEIKYQLADGFAPALWGGKEGKKTAANDLSEKLYQKVVRENEIKTETWTKFVPYTGNIKVTVTNSTNSTAIAGATVQAYQNGAAVGSVATTDASGNAVLSGLNVGTYTVKVTYGSYSATSSAVTVTKDQTVTTAVSLAVSGGSVTISVVNSRSQAVSGATVTATLVSTTIVQAEKSLFDMIMGVKTAYAGTSSFNVTNITNSSGIANFTNLPPGTYTFRVTENGLSMTSEAVTVTPGRSNTETIILPTSGGNIHVVVKDTSGTVVSGATVQLISGNTVIASGTTDSNGVAIIGGIVAGSYSVTATKSGYTAEAPTTVNATVGNTSSCTVILTVATSTVAVTVKDGAGNAINSATVAIAGTSSAGAAVSLSTSTGSSGVYTLPNVPYGTNYTLTVSANGYTPSTTTGYTVSGAVIATPVILTVATSTVTVTVKDTSNNAINGATVAIAGTSSAGAAVSLSTSTGSSGVYTLPGVPYGTNYTLTVSASGYTPSTTTGYSISAATTATLVTLAVATSMVTVTVQDGAGNAINSATVAIAGTSSAGAAVSLSTSTGSSGVYTLPGVPYGANYTLTVSANGYTPNTTTSYSISAATTTTPITLAVATSTVTVTVKDGAGNAVNGATVAITGTSSAGTAVSASISTGSNGVYTLPGVPYGTNYTLTVSANGYTPSTTTGYTVSAANTATPVTLTVATSTVTVTVKDTSNNAINGATVAIAGTSSAGAAVSLSTSTGSSGVYTLPGVPYGTNYTLTVSASGYTPSTTTGYSISAATTATLVTLAVATSMVTVTVQDGAGNAINSATVAIAGTSSAGAAVSLSTSTGSSGVYTLPGVPYGANYTLTVSANGYTPNTTTSYSISAATTTTPITLAVATSTVTVTVKDGAGNAVNGATVAITGTSSAGTAVSASTSTGSNGVYTLPGVPYGTNYTLTVSANGYTPSTTTGYTVSAANTATPVTLTVATSTVTVTVKDGSGNAINGATVAIAGTSSAGTAMSASTSTGSSGVYTLPGVPYGTNYTLTVSANGYTSSSTTGYTVSGAATATPVTLAVATSTVTVTVQDGAGNAINGATVAIAGTSSAGAAVSLSTSTGSSGVYTLPGVPYGTNYTLTVSASDYNSSTTTGYAISAATTAIPVMVSHQIGNAKITVTFSDGTTNINPTFTLDGTTNIISYANIVSGAGTSSVTYQFNGLTTGSHTIAANADNYSASGPSAVTVINNTTVSGPTITLSPHTGNTYVITITAHHADGITPEAGATVALDTGENGTTNASGQITFSNVTNGTHTVWITPSNGLYPMRTTITVSNAQTDFEYHSMWW